eukprot:1336795-Pyramimonas_sp.AAC.1
MRRGVRFPGGLGSAGRTRPPSRSSCTRARARARARTRTRIATKTEPTVTTGPRLSIRDSTASFSCPCASKGESKHATPLFLAPSSPSRLKLRNCIT